MTQPNIHPGSITSTGRQRAGPGPGTATSTGAAQLIGGGISPTLFTSPVSIFFYGNFNYKNFSLLELQERSLLKRKIWLVDLIHVKLNYLMKMKKFFKITLEYMLDIYLFVCLLQQWWLWSNLWSYFPISKN